MVHPPCLRFEMKQQLVCRIVATGGPKSDIQASSCGGSSTNRGSMPSGELGTCTNEGRSDSHTVYRDFAVHRLAGGDFDTDYSSPPQLHRGDLSNIGGTDGHFWDLNPHADL